MNEEKPKKPKKTIVCTLKYLIKVKVYVVFTVCFVGQSNKPIYASNRFPARGISAEVPQR